jgi:hypothetical protein
MISSPSLKILATTLLLGLVVSQPSFGLEPPLKVKQAYKAGDNRCRAQVPLLYQIHEHAKKHKLHDISTFAAALGATDLVEETDGLITREDEVGAKNTILMYARLYYESVQRPWVSHEDPDRVPVEILAQFSYSACRSYLTDVFNQYMSEHLQELMQGIYKDLPAPRMEEWLKLSTTTDVIKMLKDGPKILGTGPVLSA